MADNTRAATPLRRWRRVSLATWLAIAVVVAGALGAISLGFYDTGTEPVVVAAGDLPAFRAVSASDVTLREVARSAVPAGAVRSLTAIRGHYLLQPLDSEAAVTQGAVGPPAASPGTVVVPLRVGDDSPAVRPGELVDLLLTPTGQGGAAVVIGRVEVVDEVKSSVGGELAYLAVPRDRESVIAQVAGRGQAVLAALPGSTAAPPG